MLTRQIAVAWSGFLSYFCFITWCFSNTLLENTCRIIGQKQVWKFLLGMVWIAQLRYLLVSIRYDGLLSRLNCPRVLSSGLKKIIRPEPYLRQILVQACTRLTFLHKCGASVCSSEFAKWIFPKQTEHNGVLTFMEKNWLFFWSVLSLTWVEHCAVCPDANSPQICTVQCWPELTCSKISSIFYPKEAPVPRRIKP